MTNLSVFSGILRFQTANLRISEINFSIKLTNSIIDIILRLIYNLISTKSEKICLTMVL